MSSNICQFNDCKCKLFIAGVCNICNYKYCKKHRLPEKHECKILEKHKNKLRIENQELLEIQKCIKPKIY